MDRFEIASFVGICGTEILDYFTPQELIDYLDNQDTKYYDAITPLNLINMVCQSIQPSGVIDKEDTKKIICDFIDDNVYNVIPNNY
jgi:hypothetical protein